MILNKSHLLDNGVLSPTIEQIEIFPLILKELLSYLEDSQTSPVYEYTRALKYIVARDPKIGMISILNADYLLYLFKALSASKSLNLTVKGKCELCGEEHQQAMSLNQFEFEDFDLTSFTVNSIILSGTEIRIKYRTINDFLVFIQSLDRYEDTLGIDMLKLACMMQLSPAEAINRISYATQEDISVINTLDNLWFKSLKPIDINCPKHNSRGTTATLSMSAVDFFLDVLRYNSDIKDFISYGK